MKVETATSGLSGTLIILVTAPFVNGNNYIKLVVIDFLDGVNIVPPHKPIYAPSQKHIVVEQYAFD